MLKDIVIPTSRRYKSRTEWEPIGFFSETLCHSYRFDLLLGFFSSTAINVLSDGFAIFLYNGGRMRLIINDILSADDKYAIIASETVPQTDYYNLRDIEELKNVLSRRDTHFFKCLAWLIAHNRIEIVVIRPRDGMGISHTKAGIVSDGANMIAFDGSCNFSRTALIENIESINVSCDWDGATERARIAVIENEIRRILDECDESVEIIDASDIRTSIANSYGCPELAELLAEERVQISDRIHYEELPTTVAAALENVRRKVISAIDNIEKKNTERGASTTDEAPHFPYPSGPRDYQAKAYENWKNNQQRGLFAMATGTGKTITALNCLLEIYKHLGYYKALILVPTVTLVEQWAEECEKFHFANIIKVCSRYKNWTSDVSRIQLIERSDKKSNTSYIVISTYASFSKSNVFMALNGFVSNRLLLIADEAHNMGSDTMKRRMDDIRYIRRIGLSATPERKYDSSGTQKLLSFFGSTEGYTFEYSMAEAIGTALCRYFYYPHIVQLTSNEMSEYIELSRKIARVMGHLDDEGKEILKLLLLKRKRIIHKAKNKREEFIKIVKDRFREKGDLRYTLVYAAEGEQTDDDYSFEHKDYIEDNADDESIINDYTRIVRDIDSQITVQQYTSQTIDREEVLKSFAEGRTQVLTSMKCLDEGVDVPRTEMAIFCSSTDNPRQFVQRRGRILRTHPDKKYAVIHDLVVVPMVGYDESSYALERTMIEAELRRVRDFAILSENLNYTDTIMNEILNYYNLSIFE